MLILSNIQVTKLILTTSVPKYVAGLWGIGRGMGLPCPHSFGETQRSFTPVSCKAVVSLRLSLSRALPRYCMRDLNHHRLSHNK